MSPESRLAQDVADRQVAMFEMFVGPGRYTTRAALSAASKVPESTLKSYANGAAMPLHAVLAIRPHLPAAAVHMITEPGMVRFMEVEAVETDWDAIAADAAGLVGEICEARRDGHIDHVERARLKRRGRDLLAQLADAVSDL